MYVLTIDPSKTLISNKMSYYNVGKNSIFKVKKISNYYYSFYNEYYDGYLIFKGRSDGYNNDKGFTEEYNESICKLHISQHAQPTIRITGKRTNGTDGTITLLNDGTFDAFADKDAYTDSYSNRFYVVSIEK